MATTFREQLIRTIPALTSYARSLTRSRSEADDLVQDTLERALAKQALYVDAGPLIGWLKTMMQNLFIDGVRSRRRRERLECITLDEAQGRSSVKASQEDRRFLRELEELLARLPRNGGNIVMAVAVHGDGYDHVAAQFNVRPGTIRSRLSRSRAALSRASLMSAPLPSVEGSRRRLPSGLPCSRPQLAFGR